MVEWVDGERIPVDSAFGGWLESLKGDTVNE